MRLDFLCGCENYIIIFVGFFLCNLKVLCVCESEVFFQATGVGFHCGDLWWPGCPDSWNNNKVKSFETLKKNCIELR